MRIIVLIIVLFETNACGIVIGTVNDGWLPQKMLQISDMESSTKSLKSLVSIYFSGLN